MGIQNTVRFMVRSIASLKYTPPGDWGDRVSKLHLSQSGISVMIVFWIFLFTAEHGESAEVTLNFSVFSAVEK
jgi:hypothetical protein